MPWPQVPAVTAVIGDGDGSGLVLVTVSAAAADAVEGGVASVVASKAVDIVVIAIALQLSTS